MNQIYSECLVGLDIRQHVSLKSANKNMAKFYLINVQFAS